MIRRRAPRDCKKDAVINLYNDGLTTPQIAEKLGVRRQYVSGVVSRARKAGVITTYNQIATREGKLSARRFWEKTKLKTGTMSAILDEMSEEVRMHYALKCANGGYETLAELFADELIERFFEGQ